MPQTEICSVCCEIEVPERSFRPKCCHITVCNQCLCEWADTKLDSVEPNLKWMCPSGQCPPEPVEEFQFSVETREHFSIHDKNKLLTKIGQACIKHYLRCTSDVKFCPQPNCTYAGFADPN